MSMPEPKKTVTWEVNGSTETTRPGANNTLVRGRLVEYTTGQNGTGTVFIPDNVTDPEIMRQIISQAAGRTDMIDTLRSGS